MLLDEVHLEDERLQLGTHHNPFNIRDTPDHLAGFKGHVRGILEIRTHPVFKVDGLTNVNYLSAGILHEVTARFVREGLEYPLYLFIMIHENKFYQK